ncbi:MAG: helix-turn-helix domain-containing protein [Comamonadaceae bacterium]|nr:helix-turn-helix domain-containing protein [Comamonadaceae bacterium]
MDALKGHPLEAFDRSIDVHISRIRAVIEDDPKAPRRVLTVRGAGYVFARKQDAEARPRAAGADKRACATTCDRCTCASTSPWWRRWRCSRWSRAGCCSATSTQRARARRGRGARTPGGLGRTVAALAAARPTRRAEEQATALREWSQRLRVPMALDDAARAAHRRRPIRSLRRQAERRRLARATPIRLDDGRTLWLLRATLLRGGPPRSAGGAPERAGGRPAAVAGAAARRRASTASASGAAARGAVRRRVAAGAYPVVRRLTRRLEALQAAASKPSAPATLQQPRRRGRPRRGGRAGRQLQPVPPRASRRCCARTRVCWPTPATSCARRWRG